MTLYLYPRGQFWHGALWWKSLPFHVINLPTIESLNPALKTCSKSNTFVLSKRACFCLLRTICCSLWGVIKWPLNVLGVSLPGSVNWLKLQTYIQHTGTTVRFYDHKCDWYRITAMTSKGAKGKWDFPAWSCDNFRGLTTPAPHKITSQ